MKNKRIKTIILAIQAACFMAFSVMTVFAAKGVIYFSDPQASVGDTVNVTVKVETDSAALGRADITLKYPESALEFLEGHNCDGGAGIVRIHGNVSGGNVSQLDYSISFKALKPGQHAITVDSTEIYDVNENAVELTHTGSSTVSVSGGAQASSNALLKELQVSPGSLEPKFDPAVNSYTLNVGMNVEALSITAQAEDDKALVSVTGNENLSEGENTVTVTVSATDGTSKNEYVIKVTKSAEGEDNVLSSAAEITESQLADGVQLSSKGKTITVLDLPSDMNVPASFREGTISIDGNPVQGLVSSADGTEPEYIVIYGMNDVGEMNFYRFDMKEKTIQRYFADPVSNDTVSVEEFNEVQTKLNDTSKQSDLRFIVLCILGVAAFALLITVILLAVRMSSINSENKRTERYRERNDKDILKHGYTGKAEEPEAERTVVISHKPAKNDAAEITDETVVIRSKEEDKKEKEDLDGFEEFKL